MQQKVVRLTNLPEATTKVIPTSPSNGGEEVRRAWMPAVLSPLLRRGERKQKRAPKIVRKKPAASGITTRQRILDWRAAHFSGAETAA